MTAAGLVAVLLAGAAGLLVSGRGQGASSRLRAAGLPAGPRAGRPLTAGRPPNTGIEAPGITAVPAWLPRVCAGGAAAATLAGRGALAAALVVVATATWLPGRRLAAARHRDEEATSRDLPRVADLMAACLEAGLSVPDAATLVGGAVTGPLGAEVRQAGAALRSGAEPGVVWSAGGAHGPGWARFAAALERGSSSGAPLAGLLRALADDERDQARWAAEAAAQRAGVRAVGPLVACFLPAFVLVGVVPLVVGVAEQVVGDLG